MPSTMSPAPTRNVFIFFVLLASAFHAPQRTTTYGFVPSGPPRHSKPQLPTHVHAHAAGATGAGGRRCTRVHGGKVGPQNFDNFDLPSQIFVNVELNGEQLESVGFDMDFTLAQYNEAFDLLAFEGAKQKLVNVLGYPREVLDFKYSADSFRRGLIIDRARGNVIKVDRHKYVRKVYHGYQELESAQRKAIYGSQVASFTESSYVNIDTIFLIVDAVLFTSLVDLKDRMQAASAGGACAIASKSYDQLYKDVRQCVDLCHRDGVIKDAVMRDPSQYIIYDDMMVPMLRRLKHAGKKVFLLTNSMWEYTTVVMNYLVHSRGEHPDVATWEDLFDVIVVGAAKPAFLSNDYMSLFQVEPSGVLRNIEDKDALSLEGLQGGNKIFQGGHWQDLHKIMGISSGDKVLYVGDHMYSDILRSKRSLGWRTCLIIPELEHELRMAEEHADLAAAVMNMRTLQYDLDEYLDLLRLRWSMGVDVAEQLKEAEAKSEELKGVLRNMTDNYNAKFNPTWGQLFKAGHQDSRFAKQVMDYACLYTSRASNLGRVSPLKSFLPAQEFVAHDQLLYDIETR